MVAISGAPPAICGTLVDTARTAAKLAAADALRGTSFELLRLNERKIEVESFEVDMAITRLSWVFVCLSTLDFVC